MIQSHMQSFIWVPKTACRTCLTTHVCIATYRFWLGHLTPEKGYALG